MSVAHPPPRQVMVRFPVVPNEQGEAMLWLASWLCGGEGLEGDWFYSGRGGEETAVAPPNGAVGMRIRRWISDGLPPEYVDCELAESALTTTNLAFDRRQPHTRLTPASNL